jgi:hypothetical protein
LFYFGQKIYLSLSHAAYLHIFESALNDVFELRKLIDELVDKITKKSLQRLAGDFFGGEVEFEGLVFYEETVFML